MLLVLTALGGSASASGRDGGAGRAAIAKKSTVSTTKLKPKKMYWGAWIGDQLTGTRPPWDMNPVAILEAAIGKGMSLVEFSGPFSDCTVSPCAPFEFPTEGMQTIRQHGAIPFLSWSAQTTPWDSGVPTNNKPNITLASVINGSHDAYIHEFAAAAAAWGHPFFLRFNWEMNGRWFPWSESANSNRRGEFVPAWRHVHDIFVAEGATNATWVWCLYADSHPKMQYLPTLYPGDSYVDWTCLDGYNWGESPTNAQPWRSFDKILAPGYQAVAQTIAPKKPMILAELASHSAGGSKAGWIRNMMKVLPLKYPKIRGLIWFDSYDRGIDWPLETSPTSLREFSKGVLKPNYAANIFSTLETRPIRPLR